ITTPRSAGAIMKMRGWFGAMAAGAALGGIGCSGGGTRGAGATTAAAATTVAAPDVGTGRGEPVGGDETGNVIFTTTTKAAVQAALFKASKNDVVTATVHTPSRDAGTVYILRKAHGSKNFTVIAKKSFGLESALVQSSVQQKLRAGGTYYVAVEGKIAEGES